MKRIIAAVLCAVLLSMSLGVGAQAAQPSLVVLGDSIAAGSGVQDKADAYAWLVAEELGYALHNFGAGGDTSALMLQKLKENETVRRETAAAEVIAVSIGGNDFLHADSMLGLIVSGWLGDFDPIEPVLAAFRANFSGIIKELRALNPEATLVVQTLYNPVVPELPALSAVYDEAVSGINDVIFDYLADHEDAFLVADVYAAFQGKRGLVFVDLTHPSAGGHAVIAEELMKTLGASPAPAEVRTSLLDALAWLLRPLLFVLDRGITLLLNTFYAAGQRIVNTWAVRSALVPG